MDSQSNEPKPAPVVEFESSKLGTQKYWNDFYTRELENFQDNKDEGEIWFGYNRMMKVVKWITNNNDITTDAAILDIGCGNGAFLIELASEDYHNLYGIDYSETGISLARNIATVHDQQIKFLQADFLNLPELLFDGVHKKFDVCHDKGTYDAVSLRPDDAKISRLKYLENLKNLLSACGLFIITSCNWTVDELKMQFGEDLDFVLHIPAPTFQYGGQTGATVSTAVFRNK